MKRSESQNMRIIRAMKQVTADEIEAEQAEAGVLKFRAEFQLHVARNMLTMWMTLTPREYRLKMNAG